MAVTDQKEERRWHAERIISQGRERLVDPLAEELAQIAASAGKIGALHSSGHVEGRLRLYLEKARGMGKVVADAYLRAAKSPDDFTVEEIHRVALREIDALRLKAYQDLNEWAARGFSGPQDALCRRVEAIKQATLRDIQVALDAWRLDEARAKTEAKGAIAGNEVFVAMSFNRDLDPLFLESIQPAVNGAARITGRALTAYRVDRDEPETTITEAILKKIELAPIVIGDLTDERPNCYYELGYARGTGKRLILSARADHDPRRTPRSEDAPRVHFDLDTHKITWWTKDDLDSLRAVLTERIVKALTGGTD